MRPTSGLGRLAPSYHSWVSPASPSRFTSDGAELIARLQYIIRTRAFGLTRGEVGAGKSTAVRALYDQLDRTQHQFVYIADAELNSRSFYRDVLIQFGIHAPFHGREAKRKFEATLLEGYRTQSRQPVIVLDEAHLLAPDTPGDPLHHELPL